MAHDERNNKMSVLLIQRYIAIVTAINNSICKTLVCQFDLLGKKVNYCVTVGFSGSCKWSFRL